MAGHRDLNERKLSNTTFITTETESVRPTTALSAAPTTSPRNFEFIHLSHDAPTADAGARQRVRSHAMRDFRRRKGLPDMFDEQETGKSPSPGTSGPSPPSVEVRHQGSDPTDQGFKRLTPENKTRVPLGSSSSSAQQHQSLPDNPMSSQTESSDTAGIVDQQGPNLPSRPENVAHEQPDIDRGKSLVPQNNPAALLGNDSGGEPQDPSDTTLEAQKRSDSNALAMVRVPSAASFDPFNSLPVISTERVRVLVHYYHSFYIHTGVAMSPRHCWFNNAITDQALFTATLLHCAGYYAMFDEHPNLAECFSLLGETSRLVNRNLRDPVKAISDINVAAVTALAFFETILGNEPAASVHIEGLKRMVDLRGGLHTLGLGGFLQRLVSWADLWNAILKVSTPLFPHVEIATPALPTNYPLIDPSLSGPEPLGQNSQFSFTSVPEEDQGEICGMIQCLQQLSRVLVSADLAVKDAILYSESVYVYERRLLHCLLASYQSNTRPLADFILRSYVWAAFIYTYSTLRRYQLSSMFYGIFVKRLRGVLNHTEFLRQWSYSNPAMLLWVLVVGAVAAKRRPQRTWFVSQLKPVCAVLNIASAEQMRWLLQQFIWAGCELGLGLNALWAELEVEVSM